MGNIWDSPLKKFACVAGAVVVLGATAYYLSKKKPQNTKSKYLEILDRNVLAALLKQIRKSYSERFVEARRAHRSKRRRLNTESELYRSLVMKFNTGITRLFEEVRDSVLQSHGISKDLLENSVNFYEASEPEIANLALNASVPLNNARLPKSMNLDTFREITGMYEEMLTSVPNMEEDEYLYQVAKLDDEIYETLGIEPEELDKFYSKHEEELKDYVSMLKVKTNVVFTSSETREDSF